LIIASDGMWDDINKKDIEDIVYRNLGTNEKGKYESKGDVII